jgi:DNA-directed RNA polymerase omega subunit
MGYPPIENLLPKTGFSIYKLVRMAANRAIELSDGKRSLVDVPNVEKTTTIALEEIAAGKIVLKELAEQFKPKEKSAAKKAEELKAVEA